MEAVDNFLGLREISAPVSTKKCSPKDLSVKIRRLLLLVRPLSDASTPNGEISFPVYQLMPKFLDIEQGIVHLIAFAPNLL